MKQQALIHLENQFKSSAMTAFGLALMQNKAGKGFNVGNMLSSVGEAGEKALPLARRG